MKPKKGERPVALKDLPMIFGRDNICARFGFSKHILYKLEKMGAPIRRYGKNEIMVIKTTVFATYLNTINIDDLIC